MVGVKVIKKTLPATAIDFIPNEAIDEKDWLTSVFQYLLHSSSTVTRRELKNLPLPMANYIFETVKEF